MWLSRLDHENHRYGGFEFVHYGRGGFEFVGTNRWFKAIHEVVHGD